MDTQAALPSPRRLARLGGLFYLAIILCGVIGEAAVRGPVRGANAADTLDNLLNAQLLFRVSMLGDVAMALADVALGVVLYVLLAPVSRTLSLAAMAFRLAQAAALGLNLVHLQEAVAFAHNPALDELTRAGLVTGALDAHAAGYDLALFFFAINCLIVGVLAVRSGWIPRTIGIAVAAAGAVYLIGSTLRILSPALAEAFAPAYGLPLVAELALCGWLLAGRTPTEAPRVSALG